MKIRERFLTTGIGSLPYRDIKEAVDRVYTYFDIPFWPQLPRRSFKENMYVQYAEGLPGVVIDEDARKIFVDTTRDLSEELGCLYEAYLTGDYTGFGISEEFAVGLYYFANNPGLSPFSYIKGQVTGPVSFGLSVPDHKSKSIIYDDTLREALVKLLEIKSSYQIAMLKKAGRDVIIFIDEPYLTSFGSSYVNIERRDVISMLNNVIERIHSEGAISGIHCCGNTDWSLLAETGVDIINFDAYSYSGALSLYPDKIRGFLKRDGYLAWGIIPTSEDSRREKEDTLADRLLKDIDVLCEKGVPRTLLLSQCLFTPSCGTGTLSPELTDIILARLKGFKARAIPLLGAQ